MPGTGYDETEQSRELRLETNRMESIAYKVLNLARGTEHEDCARAALDAAQRISDAAWHEYYNYLVSYPKQDRMVIYTDPALVTGTRQTGVPNGRRSVSGYGGKIPTCHMLRYAGRWRRVYVMCYSNSGTAYVIVSGAVHVLDIGTEYMLEGSGNR
jgi:hypothetical protein